MVEINFKNSPAPFALKVFRTLLELSLCLGMKTLGAEVLDCVPRNSKMTCRIPL